MNKWLITIAILLVIIALPAIYLIPKCQVSNYRAELSVEDFDKLDYKDRMLLKDKLYVAENNARVTTAQAFGGLLLFISILIALRNAQIAQENAKTAQDTLRVTEEGKLTERFSKAVELLGNDKLDTRLGGIYALERIARDSLKDHWTVMEILTAFIREKSVGDWRNRNKKAVEDKIESAQDAPASTSLPTVKHKVEADIQAALSVIGRRKWIDSEATSQRLDFRGAKLMKIEINGGNFDHALFEDVILERAKIIGASFIHANLTKASLVKAIIQDSDVSDAEFTATWVMGADLVSAIGLSWNQLATLRGGELAHHAKLPVDLETKRKAALQEKLEMERAKKKESEEAHEKWLAENPLRKALSEALRQKKSEI